MPSRAALLLGRAFLALADQPVAGVRTAHVRNSPFDWEIEVDGEPGTPWEGGLFKAFLSFSETFDEAPPLVSFVTVPFHPNIDMKTGRTRIPLLDDPELFWRPGDLRRLLTSLRAVLARPLEGYPPANPAAHRCWQERPRLYEQLVRDCVVASRRLDAGLALAEEEEEEEEKEEEGEEEHGRADADEGEDDGRRSGPAAPAEERPPTAQISFEDYNNYWRFVGTSFAADVTEGGGNRFVLRRSPRVHVDVAALEDLGRRQHDILYGRFLSTGDPRERPRSAPLLRSRALRAARIRKLRRVYHLDDLKSEPDRPVRRIRIPSAPVIVSAPDVPPPPPPVPHAPAAAARRGPAQGEDDDDDDDAARAHVEWDVEAEAERRLNDTGRIVFMQSAALGGGGGDLERWEEEEADDLVQWSSRLDVRLFEEQ